MDSSRREFPRKKIHEASPGLDMGSDALKNGNSMTEMELGLNIKFKRRSRSGNEHHVVCDRRLRPGDIAGARLGPRIIVVW
jgi:hypothetical protein